MIKVGQVGSAFGVRGGVKVYSLTDFDDRFDAGSVLLLGGAEHRVEWRLQSAGALVVKLSGVDDRSTAEGLRGGYLEVPDEDLRPSGADAWYVDQLLGLRVRAESGRALGTLVEVLERPANDVWVVRDAGLETLVPATRDAVRSVHLPEHEVVVADWLLNVEEA